MNVRELLEQCDCRSIAEQYVARRNYYGSDNMPSVEEAEKGIQSFVARLLQKDVRNDGKWIIVPVSCVDDSKREINAERYEISSVLDFVPELNMAEMETQVEKAKNADLEYVAELVANPATPAPHMYTFEDWEDILGYQVYLLNENMMSAVAEDVLWYMAFNGTTNEAREVRMQEIFDDLKEAEEQIESGQCLTWGELKKRLHDEIGYEDTRTQEEKDASRRQCYVEMLENKITRTCVLLACQAYLQKSR